VDPESNPAIRPLGGDGVIEVVSAGGIDGEGREIPEIAAVEIEGLCPIDRFRGLLLDPAREARPDLAILQHRRDHVGREPRIAELPDHPPPAATLPQLDHRHPPWHGRAPAAAELDLAAALEQKLADEEPATLRDEDYALQS
jgi:hypothetical protein